MKTKQTPERGEAFGLRRLDAAFPFRARESRTSFGGSGPERTRVASTYAPAFVSKPKRRQAAALQRLAPVLALLLFSGALRAADPTPVKTTTAKRADIHRWITIPGTLKANQQATLYAKVAGYLTNVAVDKGDAVKADQLLGELEVPELLADAKRYDADVKIAQIDLARLIEAQKKAPDLVLPQALDKARAASDVARANLERTNTLLHFAKITAPFSGVITARFVDNGAFVPAATSGSAQNAAIFTVMDYTTVRAQVAVPELETLFIRAGLPVKIGIEALPGKSFDATVSRAAGALDESTRTMLAEADMPNPAGTFRPGMYANVKIAVEKHTGVLVVPVEALAMEKTNAFVFKIADGKAKKTALKLGFNDGANAEVIEGLGEGESVIIVGKGTFTDGPAVKPEVSK